MRSATCWNSRRRNAETTDVLALELQTSKCGTQNPLDAGSALRWSSGRAELRRTALQFIATVLRVLLPWAAILWIYRALQSQQRLERELTEERIDHLELQLRNERARREQAELMARQIAQASGSEPSGLAASAPSPTPNRPATPPSALRAPSAPPTPPQPAAAPPPPPAPTPPAATQPAAPPAAPEPAPAAAAMPSEPPPAADAAPAIPADRSAASHLDEGNAYFGAGNYDAAVNQYARAIDLDANSAAAYYNRANALVRLDRTEEAANDYERAIELAPDDPDIYVNRGLLRLFGRDFDTAEGDFRHALRLRPDDGAAHTNLGLTLLYEDRAQEALDSFQSAVRLEPDQPGAHYGLASAAAKLGQADDAVAALRQATQLNPRYAEAARTDDHFDGLRGNQAFESLVGAGS
ncbi:MAG: tetratricopeptide repeat protein [Chloroflexi bacterium]|nr:tetratricopeptide repeat protein [Chloroflexota bacterium]